jgi:hypothetical protein
MIKSLSEECQFGLVIKLLHGEQVARLVWQEGLGKFRDFFRLLRMTVCS